MVVPSAAGIAHAQLNFLHGSGVAAAASARHPACAFTPAASTPSLATGDAAQDLHAGGMLPRAPVTPAVTLRPARNLHGTVVPSCRSTRAVILPVQCHRNIAGQRCRKFDPRLAALASVIGSDGVVAKWLRGSG